MFDNIEEIYLRNNTCDKKYAKIVIPITFVIIVLMIIFLIMKKILLLYVFSFIGIFLIFILKVCIYWKTVKPRNIIDIILIDEKYKRLKYNKTKNDIVEILKENNNYDIDSVNMLIDYYKDLTPKKEFDIFQVSNYLFSFLSALGVLLTIENQEGLNVIYIIVWCVLIMIALFWGENKILEKLSEGILDYNINYKFIYKIVNEIALEIISKNKRVYGNT